MKTIKIKLILTCVIIISAVQVNAKVWRVNNTAGISADFSSISAAMAAASAGDTLYIEGSFTSYGNVVLSKQLVLIGTGFFIPDNDSTQANQNASQIGTLTINAGAQGSIISGISANSTTSNTNTVTINTNNITISRCYIYNYPASSSGYSGIALYINSNASNIVIEKSYIYQARYTTSSGSYTYYTSALQLAGNNTGIIVMNNIIRVGSRTATAYYYSYAVQMATNSSAIFTNNVIIGGFQAYNSTVTNNIQITGGSVVGNYITSTSNPNVTKNNIGFSTQFGTTDGNQSNVTMANVFTYNNSEFVDNHYELKSSSPAIGAGVSGEDCGIFGGTGAYVLSGIPPIPSIFNATVPPTGTTSGGININIKSKTNN